MCYEIGTVKEQLRKLSCFFF